MHTNFKISIFTLLHTFFNCKFCNRKSMDYRRNRHKAKSWKGGSICNLLSNMCCGSSDVQCRSHVIWMEVLCAHYMWFTWRCSVPATCDEWMEFIQRTRESNNRRKTVESAQWLAQILTQCYIGRCALFCWRTAFLIFCIIGENVSHKLLAIPLINDCRVSSLCNKMNPFVRPAQRALEWKWNRCRRTPSKIGRRCICL